MLGRTRLGMKVGGLLEGRASRIPPPPLEEVSARLSLREEYYNLPRRGCGATCGVPRAAVGTVASTRSPRTSAPYPCTPRDEEPPPARGACAPKQNFSRADGVGQGEGSVQEKDQVPKVCADWRGPSICTYSA